MSSNTQMIAIGGSAGSLDVLFTLLSGLSPRLTAAIIIVLHRMPSSSISSLDEVLQARTKLRVKEAEEKEDILPGCIYLAPADYHLLVEKNRSFSLDISEKINFSRPAIDVTFQTAAEAYGPNMAAILLSGANTDGVKGLLSVKHNGGITAAQDPATARSPYMPQKAIKAQAADHVLSPLEMADFINRAGQNYNPGPGSLH